MHFDYQGRISLRHSGFIASILRNKVNTMTRSMPRGLMSVVTGEKASNTDPQLTVHHLYPLNKRLHKRYIHPLLIYSIFDEKQIQRISTRDWTCDRASRGYQGITRMYVACSSAWGPAVHTVHNENIHVEVALIIARLVNNK